MAHAAPTHAAAGAVAPVRMKRRRRADLDPDRPKPTVSGYLRFLLEPRAEIARNSPGMMVPEVRCCG